MDMKALARMYAWLDKNQIFPESEEALWSILYRLFMFLLLPLRLRHLFFIPKGDRETT